MRLQGERPKTASRERRLFYADRKRAKDRAIQANKTEVEK